MSERTEAFYDSEIAPRLLEVARLCKEAGMPFVASVEYEPNCCGLTADHPNIHDCGPSFRLARYAVFSRGNIDALITAIRRDDDRHANGETKSVYLRQLANYSRLLDATAFGTTSATKEKP